MEADRPEFDAHEVGTEAPQAASARGISEVRTGALLGAAMLAVLSGLFARANGYPAGAALFLGLGSGLAGLGCWAAYHLASRRADGLLVIGLPIVPVLLGENHSPLGTLAMSIVWIPLATLVGLLRRSREPIPGDCIEGDADLDPLDEDEDGHSQ